ncbi:hypothetical protein [Burkholderia pseudomallei]|uniref:hypothetical protein n=1 Tax=Burkholderia pseudomallei TaxID=28450 RepID=UPI001E5625D5|nr:hypothetical protein [Burkholderia pseudomallei]
MSGGLTTAATRSSVSPCASGIACLRRAASMPSKNTTPAWRPSTRAAKFDKWNSASERWQYGSQKAGDFDMVFAYSVFE